MLNTRSGRGAEEGREKTRDLYASRALRERKRKDGGGNKGVYDCASIVFLVNTIART